MARTVTVAQILCQDYHDTGDQASGTNPAQDTRERGDHSPDREHIIASVNEGIQDDPGKLSWLISLAGEETGIIVQLFYSPCIIERIQHSPYMPDDHISGYCTLGSTVIGIVSMITHDEVFAFLNCIWTDGIPTDAQIFGNSLP